MILRFGLFILKPYCLILHFPKNLINNNSKTIFFIYMLKYKADYEKNFQYPKLSEINKKEDY